MRGFGGSTVASPVPIGGVAVGGVLRLGLLSDFASAGDGGLGIVDVAKGLAGVVTAGDEGRSLLSGFVFAEPDTMVSSGFLVSAKHLCCS